MTDQTTGFQVAADINPFEASMRRLVDSARDGQAGVAGAFGQLEGIRNLFLGIGAAIGAIKFTEFVTSTLEAAGGLKDLSQKTGMTVESLSGMQSIAKLSGTSLDTIAGASNKLAFTLSGASEESKGASAAIGALGIDFKTFSALSPEERLLAVSKAMNEFKDGSGKSAVAMALFGKAGAEMLPFMNDLAEAGKLNYKVTTEQANAADNFGDNLVKLNANTNAWQKTLVYGLAPALSDLSTALVDVFQQAGGLKDQIGRLSEEGKLELWARQATTLLTYLSDAISLVVNVVGTAILAIGTPIMQLIRVTYGLFDALSKLLTLNFSGFVDAISSAFSEASTIGRKNYEDLVSLWSGPTLGQRVRASLAKPKDESASTDSKKDLVFDNVSGATKTEKSQMPVYEAELAKKIELFEKAAQAEGTLRQFSKAEEAAYWKEVSTRAGLSTEDKARAEKKWRDLERTLRTDSFTVEMADIEQRKQAAQNNFAERIRLAEQAHAKTVAMYGAESKEAAASYGKILEEKRKLVQRQIQLDNIASGLKRDKALADIEFERQDADYQLNMGLITKQQMLMQEMQFQERMSAIKRQALQKSLALIDPDNDPVKAAEIRAQIEQLETQHQLRLRGIKNQLSAAKAGPEINMFQSMQTSFEQATTSMIMQAQNLRQALSGIFKSVSSVFVTEMVSKPLALMAARVVRESSLYQMLSNIAIANQAKASGVTTALVEGEQAPKLAAIAPVVGAKGAESQAGIPIVGPALAAAAFAAMVAMVMGAGKGGGSSTTTTRIPSASGGFDIPRGLNPMTQLHEEEMVLPAHIANPLRDSLAQGSADAQGAGQGGTVVIHTTGGDFIHKRDLAKVLTAMKRDFRFA